MYAEKRLERIKAAAEKASTSMKVDSALSNGTIANGHTNGYMNGVSKRKTQ